MAEPSTLLTLTIDRPVHGGRMLARHEGRVVFVAGGIPGERVRARVERTTRQQAWASTVEVLDESPDRRETGPDPACGGMAYAHIAYARQRTLKGEVIADAFRRIARAPLADPVPVMASPEHGYRLRARLRVAGRRVGFSREGTHHVCDAAATGQLLPGTTAVLDGLVERLGRRLGECSAFVLAENVAATNRVVHLDPRPGATLRDLQHRLDLPAGLTGITTVSRGRLLTLAGQATVTDAAADLWGDDASPIGALPAWTRHAPSFFQGNRFLLGALVGRVLDCCVGERFVDLYAGVGLFTVALAARGGQVVAVEGDRLAGADLAANAKPWRTQLHVVRSTVEEAVSVPLDPPPDVVILDPPRAGVSAETLAGVTRWAPPRVVYVSCDPPTLARDARRLADSGYRLHAIDAFDLFPNTPHVEVVAVFNRESG
jgi:tRNA/tmRNA/rRNA uracil-C5-methylase (TrmA/RlmC/RlmD family)